VFRALEGVDAWLVGGVVRDQLLGRATDDVDIAVAAEPEPLAKALRSELGGAAFPLGEGFGGWRVTRRDGEGHVDLLPLVGGSLETDLAARDFTINAMARPLAGGELIDPHGGAGDLDARRLRAVRADSFTRDPLRVLRLVRLAAELGFDMEDVAAARAAAPGLEQVAAERVFAELTRILMRGSEAVRAFEAVGAADVVLPELVALQGVEQSVYHHADVHDHTLAVLDAVGEVQEREADLRVHAVLDQPLANELTRWQAMRFAALLHDIAKPGTAGVRADGRGSSFVGHDRAGAEIARGILRRLRASERLAEHTAALTLHHLRLGFLVHERPLGRRAIHRYLQATAPYTVDITVFTCADRLATRGRNAETATEAHLALARELLDEAFADRPAQPLVRGNELARELGIRPGPELGELLARLEEDRFAGEIATRAEAIARAREYLAER
jgi:putative nucleotidyltransferase with HDIG domain